MVKACCTTLPSMMVSTTSRRLAFLVKLVFAVFQFVLRLEQQRAGDEQIGLVDHALAHQQIGGVADAAARDVDDLVLRRAGPAGRSAACRSRRPTPPTSVTRKIKRQQRVAGDDERIAGALASAPRRHRHVLGLQRGARAARRDRSGRARGAVERRRLQRRIRLAGAGHGARAVGRQRRRGQRPAAAVTRLRRGDCAGCAADAAAAARRRRCGRVARRAALAGGADACRCRRSGGLAVARRRTRLPGGGAAARLAGRCERLCGARTLRGVAAVARAAGSLRRRPAGAGSRRTAATVAAGRLIGRTHRLPPAFMRADPRKRQIQEWPRQNGSESHARPAVAHARRFPLRCP